MRFLQRLLLRIYGAKEEDVRAREEEQRARVNERRHARREARNRVGVGVPVANDFEDWMNIGDPNEKED